MRRVQHTILAVDVLIRVGGGAAAAAAVHRGGSIVLVAVGLRISAYADRVDGVEGIRRRRCLRRYPRLIPELVGRVHLENRSLQKHSLLHIGVGQRLRRRRPLVALQGAQI